MYMCVVVYLMFNLPLYHPVVVPMILTRDTIVDESGGSAVLTVQLLNEIERNFTINYATGELPNEATGIYYIHVYACATQLAKFKSPIHIQSKSCVSTL